MPALRSPLVQLALAASLVGGAVGLGCGSDPTPRGYHSSNIAWSEQDMGIVWLDRRAPYEAVVFARSGEDLKLKGPSVELTQHAWHSDPPLVASDGRGWLVAWTQAGGRGPGLFVRQVGPGGPEGPQRTIVESTVRLCPQLVWTGEAYVVGWNEGDEIYLGRVGSYAMLAEAPLRIAHEASIEACRVAFGNDELGVLWSAVHGDERSLSMARVSPTGELLDRIEVRTEAPVGAGPIELVWHEDAWIVGHTSSEQPGARTVRVVSNDEQSPGPALSREGFVRSLALASASWLGTVWSETAKPGATKAQLFFDLLGNTSDPLEIGTGRPGINMSARNRGMVAVTWTSMAKGSTMHWGIIRVRPNGEARAVEAVLETASLAH
jgi:hypothetical protein